MMIMKNGMYRERIYNNYVQAWTTPLAPETTAGLKPHAPYLRQIIKCHFPQDRQASILDLGCGYGVLLYFANEAGYTNTRGVDCSLQQITAARKLGIEGVEEGDLLNTLATLDDSSQNCIITFDVIEHFTREELIPLVDELFRVLLPGGRWIIHAPNAESPFSGRMRYGDLTHELSFTRTSLAQLLLSSGFKKVQSFEDGPIPHGVNSAVRWLLWKAIRGVLCLYLAAETGDLGRGAILSQNFLTVAVK
jgi:2-polyprenyl-3-methyl-5-hydroxy-6-metoxy-1,4-benzoquinol methylase